MTDFLSWFATGAHEIRYFHVSELIFTTDREFEYCNFQMLSKDSWEKNVSFSVIFSFRKAKFYC